MVDLVHEVEEVIGLHPMHGHQAAHRSSVAFVVVLLQVEGLLMRDLEEARDVVADALVHLLPKVEVVRIERVVEIEHPGLDVAEGARGGAGGGAHDAAAIRSLITLRSGRSNARMTRPAAIAMPAIMRKNIGLSIRLQ